VELRIKNAELRIGVRCLFEDKAADTIFFGAAEQEHYWGVKNYSAFLPIEQQPLHGPVIYDMLLYDLIHIAQFYTYVKNSFGVNNNGLTEVADIEAARALCA
jgi:hypothetical protein